MSTALRHCKVYSLLLALWAAPAFAQSSYDATNVYFGTLRITAGSGSPEGVVTAPVGSQYYRNNCSTTTPCVYVKTAGSGNTGWVAVPGYGTASANTVFAGPTSGGVAVPTFRILVDADLPFGTPTQGDVVVGNGTPAWSRLAIGASPGQLLRSTGTAPAWSTTIWPNAATTGDLLYAASANTYGNLNDVATGRVLISGGVGTAPSYSATPPLTAVYGDPTNHQLSLGGSGVSGCPNPPSLATCEGADVTITSAFLEQRLKTDSSYRSQWFIGSDGGHLNAYNAGGWMAMRIDGGPTQFGGGGVHIGTNNVSDPGLGNAALDGYIGTPNYVSKTTGWRMTYAGELDARYGYLDELQVKLFTAELQRALRGSEIIAPSYGVLASDFTVPAKGSIATLILKDAEGVPNVQVLTSGHTVNVRTMSRPDGGLIVGNAFGTVSGYTDNADGTQSWTFTRFLGNDGGSLPTGTTASSGGVVLDYGTSGSGYLELTSVDGTAVITSLTRASSTATATTTAPHGLKTGDTAVISGATDSAYNGSFTITATGSTTFTYTVSGTPTTPDPSTQILVNGTNGTNAPYSQVVTWSGLSPQAANLTLRQRCGNLRGVTGTLEYGCLLGTYTGSNADKYMIFSDQQATIRNVNLDIYSGSNRAIILDPATPYLSMGVPASTAYGSGTGFFVGLDAGCMKVHIGDYSTNYIDWNCSQLTVSGNIVITGTSIDASSVNGYSGASVVSASQRGLLGFDSFGNPILPHAATPSGSGLFLGSDYMGYFASSAWKTYISSGGDFAFGNYGDGGSGISWTQATGTLSIRGQVTITSGSVPNASVTGLGALATQNTVAMGSQTTGNYAGSSSAGGSANDTALVNGVSASTVQDGAARAASGLNASGYLVTKVIPGTAAAPSGAGLYLGSDYLGYYSGSSWQTFMQSNGNFYLGGTSGALQWNASGGTLAVDGTIVARAGQFLGSLSVGTGGVLYSGKSACTTGTGFWLAYNSGTPQACFGDPSGNFFNWTGAVLDIKAGYNSSLGTYALVVDGSGNKHVGMGAGPITAATLNVASDDNTSATYSFIASNHSASAINLVGYGDGSTYVGGPIFFGTGQWDTTGNGTNPPSQMNGPFGNRQLDGWFPIWVWTGASYQKVWLPAWFD